MTTNRLLTLKRRLDSRMAGLLPPLALLTVRVLAGAAFLQAGLGKARNLDATTAFFESLGIPFAEFHAVAVSTLEVAGGIALLLGFWSRLFALLLSGTMVVALLTADRIQLESVLAAEASPVAVQPLVLLALLLVLMGLGSGLLSLDARAEHRHAVIEEQSDAHAG